jgi:hypothetical protein
MFANGLTMPYSTFNNKISQALLPFPQYSGVTDQVGSVYVLSLGFLCKGGTNPICIVSGAASIAETARLSETSVHLTRN